MTTVRRTVNFNPEADSRPYNKSVCTNKSAGYQPGISDKILQCVPCSSLEAQRGWGFQMYIALTTLSNSPLRPGTFQAQLRYSLTYNTHRYLNNYRASAYAFSSMLVLCTSVRPVTTLPLLITGSSSMFLSSALSSSSWAFK